LEPLEFDCSLHYDLDVARRYGFTNITAPYTSILTFTIPPMWQPGKALFTSDERDSQPAYSPINGNDLRVAPQLTGFFATDFEMDFLRPPMVGDHLSKRGNVLLSCVPKWVTVGRGAFITLQSEVITGDDEVIGKVRHTVFAYEPMFDGQPSGTSSKPSDVGTLANSEHAAKEFSMSGISFREGDDIEPVVFPLSVYRLVMAAGANRDFNSIHHNSEYAKKSGADEMYANTSFLLGMWERTIRNFIGLEGTLRSIRGFRMKKFNPVGTSTTVRGRILSVTEGSDHFLIDLSIWCENNGDVTVGPGVAMVSVPKS